MRVKATGKIRARGQEMCLPRGGRNEGQGRHDRESGICLPWRRHTHTGRLKDEVAPERRVMQAPYEQMSTLTPLSLLSVYTCALVPSFVDPNTAGALTTVALIAAVSHNNTASVNKVTSMQLPSRANWR
jgi:hypothetical protein